jgi:hypothetical protein
MGVDCPAIDGIIEEADEVAGEVDDKNVLDAALIAAAQAIEHYEMTRYGTLIAGAKQLGRADCAKLLEQNLQERRPRTASSPPLPKAISIARQPTDMLVALPPPSRRGPGCDRAISRLKSLAKPRPAARRQLDRILIGTSGWTYDGWRGRFYPDAIPEKDWLRFYAEQFATTEINGSFYRTPSLEAVRHWRDVKDFVFSWKASKFITHWKRLGPACANSIGDGHRSSEDLQRAESPSRGRRGKGNAADRTRFRAPEAAR